MVPDWYVNNFHDIEAAFVDFFQKVFPDITTCSWIPDDWFQEGGDTAPFLRFMRIPPGQVNWFERQEECSVQCAVGVPPKAGEPTRDQAWQVINVLRACVLPMVAFPMKYSTSYGDREVLIIGVNETVGPQLLPEIGVPDDRVVPVTFRVCFDIQNANDYLAILRDL